MKEPVRDIEFLRWSQRQYPRLQLHAMIDFGGIAVRRMIPMKNGELKEVPLSLYWTCKPIPGAMRRIEWVVRGLGAKKVLMCKGLPDECTTEMEQLINDQVERWMYRNNFLRSTGVLRENVICRTKRGKVEECVKRCRQFGGEHAIVDDRVETMRYSDVYPDIIHFILVDPNPVESDRYGFDEIPRPEEVPPLILQPNKPASTPVYGPDGWFRRIVEIRRRQVAKLAPGKQILFPFAKKM